MTGCTGFQVAWKLKRSYLKCPTPSPQLLTHMMCGLASSTDSMHFSTYNPSVPKICGCLFIFAWIFFSQLTLFMYLFIFILSKIWCRISHRLFWANSLLTPDVFRWDLRLQDPRAERPLRGSGPGQVHWRGGHQGQGEARLWAAEGAHLHHPGLRLWRGSWWRKHEEITQVSQAWPRQRIPDLIYCTVCL